MTRLILSALLVLGLAAPSLADVTGKATASGKGMGMSAGMVTTTYIKGNFSDPRGADGQPGQAKAMAEMYKQLAATGGIPYEMEPT